MIFIQIFREIFDFFFICDSDYFSRFIDESETRRSPYEDDGDEQEDDNDTNITDDEDNGGDKTMEVW